MVVCVVLHVWVDCRARHVREWNKLISPKFSLVYVLCRCFDLLC